MTTKTRTLYHYRGRQYSLTELTHLPECVVARTTLSTRLRDGWDMGAALTVPPNQRRRRGVPKHRYEYKGRLLSAPELAALPECVVALTTLRERLHDGWDAESAITVRQPPHNPSPANRYPFRGERLTLKEIATHPDCVVSYDTIRSRLFRGYPIEWAATAPPGKRNHAKSAGAIPAIIQGFLTTPRTIPEIRERFSFLPVSKIYEWETMGAIAMVESCPAKYQITKEEP